jgi:hypothetical protein
MRDSALDLGRRHVSDLDHDAERPMASKPRRRPKLAGSRIPAGSTAYARLLPALIVALAIVMGLLILVAAGVLLGLVPYR